MQADKSWNRQECIVKQECPTYDGANAALKALLHPRPKPPSFTIPLVRSIAMVQSEQTVKEENEDPLNIDGLNEVPAEPSAETLMHPDEKLSMMVSIKSLVQSLMAKQEMLEKQNARMEKQNFHIVEQNANIIERNKRIEKTNAALLTKIDLMEKTMHNLDSQSLYGVTTDLLEASSYSFEPMETVDQIKRLEKKLCDTSYRRKLLSWLTTNVTGKNAHGRMSSCLDMLFTRELATKCSWTGISRDGIEKLGMRDQRNIINLFKAIGTSPRERIDGKYVHIFLQRKLKCAKERFQRRQGCSVNNAATNPIANSEQRAGCGGIAITNADSSNAIDRLPSESLDNESQLTFEVEVLD